jgi:hypothetical protein
MPLLRSIFMTKKKIADSIIMRVGGGIREVPREPLKIAENTGSVHMESGFTQTEDIHPFGAERGVSTTNGPDEIIN